jgi:hypothetical protein
MASYIVKNSSKRGVRFYGFIKSDEKNTVFGKITGLLTIKKVTFYDSIRSSTVKKRRNTCIWSQFWTKNDEKTMKNDENAKCERGHAGSKKTVILQNFNDILTKVWREIREKVKKLKKSNKKLKKSDIFRKISNKFNILMKFMIN